MTISPIEFNPKRPKVSLRRFSDPFIRLTIQTYILNRGRQNEAKALEWVYEVINDSTLTI